jgi:branched-chain amino acid transport protein
LLENIILSKFLVASRFLEDKNLNNKDILKLSIPVFMGYFPLGITFGILAKSIGISTFIATSLSLLAYGGAAQFMILSLFSVGTGLVEIFIVSYLVNLRHLFYGMILLKDYKDIKFRIFNIATLTDETFAIFKMRKISNVNERSKFFTLLNFVSWLYWTVGTAVGCMVGGLMLFDTKGLEFSLTALFVAIAIEMFKNEKNFVILCISVFIGVLGVVFMPHNFILVGSIALCFIFLFLFKKWL